MFIRTKPKKFADINIPFLTNILTFMSERDKRYDLPSEIMDCVSDAIADRNMPEIKKLLDLANTLGIKETLIDQLYMIAIREKYNKKELHELMDICPIDLSRQIHYTLGGRGCDPRSVVVYKICSLLEVCDFYRSGKEYKTSFAKNLHLHTAKEKDALFSEQGVAKKRRM